MYTLHIPKMSCGGCVNSIKHAINKIDDAATVKADLTTRTITVETVTPVVDIIKTITDAGYAPD